MKADFVFRRCRFLVYAPDFQGPVVLEPVADAEADA